MGCDISVYLVLNNHNRHTILSARRLLALILNFYGSLLEKCGVTFLLATNQLGFILVHLVLLSRINCQESTVKVPFSESEWASKVNRELYIAISGDWYEVPVNCPEMAIIKTYATPLSPGLA
jgi:hypothetical protein